MLLLHRVNLRDLRAGLLPRGLGRRVVILMLVAVAVLGCREEGPGTADGGTAPTEREERPGRPSDDEVSGRGSPRDEAEERPPPAAATLTPETTGPSGKLADSGPVVTTEDGQVIEDLEVTAPDDISAAIVVEHDDVTIRNVKVTAPGPTSGIQLESGTTGTLIEYVEIDGQRAEYGDGREDANWGNVGIKAHGPFVARRNYIYGVRQGIQIWSEAAGATVEESYIREVWRNAPGVSTTGISYRGSDESDLLTTIAGNRITVSGMGGISISSREGPARNVHLLDNFIVGTAGPQGQTGYAIRGGYQGEHRDDARNLRIEGNRFAGTFQWGTNGAVNTRQPGNTFVNNRWIDSRTDEPPQLEL